MKTITLETYSAGDNQTQALQQLSKPQLKFLKQYTYRFDYNWQANHTELSIRKTDFNEEELTRILFLFPHAQL